MKIILNIFTLLAVFLFSKCTEVLGELIQENNTAWIILILLRINLAILFVLLAFYFSRKFFFNLYTEVFLENKLFKKFVDSLKYIFDIIIGVGGMGNQSLIS